MTRQEGRFSLVDRKKNVAKFCFMKISEDEAK